MAKIIEKGLMSEEDPMFQDGAYIIGPIIRADATLEEIDRVLAWYRTHNNPQENPEKEQGSIWD
jgi:hypothetical protein